MMPRALVFALAAFAAAPALAQADTYARHWPVRGDAPGVYAIELSADIYQQVQRADLGDLAAFNAAGETLAFGPMATVAAAAQPQWRDAVWFTLPTPSAATIDNVRLQVNRSADGAVSLRTDLDAAGTAALSDDLLVDTGIAPGDRLRVQMLALEFAPTAADVSAELRIDSSDDLTAWQLRVPQASVLRLRHGDQVLQRRTIDLYGGSARYLRVHRLDAGGALPLTALRIGTLPTDAPAPPALRTLPGEAIGRDGDAWLYRLPARIPATRINLRLAQDNAVARADIASREDAHQRWRPRGSLTAFRLRGEGVDLDNEPLLIDSSRDREWRVSTDTPLAKPPALEFTYRPEHWWLLTQGMAPYAIAAGSTRSHRDAPPLAALLAPIRAKYGNDWQPPLATLGDPVIAAGNAAIEISASERWSDRALWLLLIGAALTIGWMVVRLLRERRVGG